MQKYFPLLILLFVGIVKGIAQPGALDLSFKSDTGANNRVAAIAQQADGKLIIVGDFSTYNDMPTRGIARLSSNGQLDTSLHTGTGFSGNTNAVVLQPDGKILVGGLFQAYNGTSANYFIRLNTDGSADTTFHSGTGFDFIVHTVALQIDGKILVGGEFNNYNGTTVGHVCRLQTNGTLDSSFNTFVGADRTVEDIIVRPDGKILIGGDFNNYNNTFYIRIILANTDGSIDSNFFSLPGASRAVYDMEYIGNDKIVAVGNFDTYNFQPKNRIIQLNPNGSIDVLLDMGTGPNSELHAVKKVNDQLLIGGDFSEYNGYAINRFARLNSDGHIDTTFNTGTGPSGRIQTIITQPNGKILIGGPFSYYNGIARGSIVRVYNCLTPQPDSIYGNSYALCNGTQQTYSVTPVAGATKYEWTLPNGWLGSSDSSSIKAISDGSGGTITVKAFTDSCGYSYATTRSILTVQPPGVNICLVTVDTASTHNIVIWEKPVTNLIDSFCIYRETATNIYTKIGAVPYDSLSEYHDYAANPNVTSYRYKLSVLDTCGAESELSPYHNTIHFQNLGSGNFQWTFYQIENAANPVMSFNVYRDNLGNGNFTTIGNVPGTNATFFDNTFNSFNNSEYVVDANWGISCTPTRAVNTTRSNKRPRNAIDALSVGSEISLSDMLQVYPNPGNQLMHISYPAELHVLQLQLLNNLGQTILAKTEADDLHRLDIQQLSAGIYTLSIETNLGRVVKKIVVE